MGAMETWGSKTLKYLGKKFMGRPETNISFKIVIYGQNQNHTFPLNGTQAWVSAVSILFDFASDQYKESMFMGGCLYYGMVGSMET